METISSWSSPRFNFWITSFSHLCYLPNKLKTNSKFFADDTSLFTTIKDISKSANALSIDNFIISKWAFNWKMIFNLDSSKPAQEGLF